MVANPACGQLNGEGKYFFPLSPLVPTNLVSRDGFGRLVPHYNSSHAHSPYDALAELNLALTLAGFVFRDGVHLALYYTIPSTAIGSVSLYYSITVYRITQSSTDGVTLPPRVRRHRAGR